MQPDRRVAGNPVGPACVARPRYGHWLLPAVLSLVLGNAVAQEGVPPRPSVVMPPVVPVPGPGVLVVSCDPGGCWDEFGVRYDRADAGVFVRGDGKSCLRIKGRMRCE